MRDVLKLKTQHLFSRLFGFFPLSLAKTISIKIFLRSLNFITLSYIVLYFKTPFDYFNILISYELIERSKLIILKET
jgi:hypothetical protein